MNIILTYAGKSVLGLRISSFQLRSWGVHHSFQLSLNNTFSLIPESERNAVLSRSTSAAPLLSTQQKNKITCLGAGLTSLSFFYSLVPGHLILTYFINSMHYSSIIVFQKRFDLKAYFAIMKVNVGYTFFMSISISKQC